MLAHPIATRLLRLQRHRLVATLQATFVGSPTATVDQNGWTHVVAQPALGNIQERTNIPGVGWYGWSAITPYGQTTYTPTP